MITSSGAMCDVCGYYILPVDPDEQVNLFGISQMPGATLCAHNKCKDVILNCGGDWTKLPTGPLRTAYEEAAAKMEQTK